MFYLLLESILIYGNLDDDTHIVVYTSTEFMNMIRQSHLYHKKIVFEINDTYTSIDLACKARLDLFELPRISNYDKILYLDTDIIIKDDINRVFEICNEDILYTLQEGSITAKEDYWGRSLFGNEITQYKNTSAFSSGILLFNNCKPIQCLFENIKKDIIERPRKFECYDQPYFVYHAFKNNIYNNNLLKLVAVNNNYNINSIKVIHHFPGDPGIYENKIMIMTTFLNRMKDVTVTNNIENAKQYINTHLLPIIRNCGEPLEGNIFTAHHTTQYTDVYLNKSKNISNVVLHRHINYVMEIGFNAGFSTLLMLLSNPTIHITCFDLGEHKYTLPCYEKLKETFRDRITIVIGDSRFSLLTINETYDVIHIDGGHSDNVAMSDIIHSYRLSKHGSLLIMDDYDFDNLHKLWDHYIKLYKLHPIHITSYPTPHHDIKYVLKE
jgi:predicted O-methyltransferase YrrM